MKENKKPNSFERASKILKNTDVKYVLVVVENVENGGFCFFLWGTPLHPPNDRCGLSARRLRIFINNNFFHGVL